MIAFLIKGILRDRSRSLFPVLMVAAGSFLVVFLYSWMNGVFDDLIRANARFDTGHVKVVTRSYWEHQDQLPTDLSLMGVGSLLTELEELEPSMTWASRIHFAGIIDVPDSKGETRVQGPVAGLAVAFLDEDSPETELLDIKKSLVRGNVPRRPNEIVVSDEFAQKLDVQIGEKVTLIGATMFGSMAMSNFTVVGTVVFGIPILDRGSMIADIADIRRALDMEDAATEIVGFSESMFYDEKTMITLSDRFNGLRSDSEDEFAPYMVALSHQNDLGEYLAMIRIFGTFIVTLFSAVMSLVLWNSGLMNGIRRYGEIGLRLAMGESRGTLYRWMLFESLVTGLIGSAIGTFFGVCISYYLQVKGIDFGSMMQQSQLLISGVYRARVTGWSFIIGFFPGLLAPFMGTLLAGIGIYKRQTSQLFKELEI